MNWKLWFARDAVVWQVLFYGGLVAVALASAPQAILDTFPAWVMSAMPTVRFAAFISLIVGGKMGLSFADKKANLQ